MTDKQLLDGAAKAAGYDFVTENDPGEFVAWKGREPIAWNPLANDGDALRLAVKLGLQVFPVWPEDRPAYVSVFTGKGHEKVDEPLWKDGMEGTRRAIVRAAALRASQ